MKQVKDLFFQTIPLEEENITQLTRDSLRGLDDGDLYIQHAVSSSLTLEDSMIRVVIYDTTSGFGLRGIMDGQTIFAHASDFDLEKLKEASRLVQNVRNGYDGTVDLSSLKYTKKSIYELYDESIVTEYVPLFFAMDRRARCDSRVVQVSIRCSIDRSLIGIFSLRDPVFDIRPLIHIAISVVVNDNNRCEYGYYGFGGREKPNSYFNETRAFDAVDRALEQALINLEARRPAPAGEMPVILGSGWPGILLHEAVGHGLEGDFNRKKTSAFWNRMNSKIAFEGITVVDDGTIEGRRGSLMVDDEGTPTTCTTLIESGILTGYMQDRLNARLMGMKLTGNGRRESYAHLPMPRMTNTYMLKGDSSVEDMIASVKKGIYAVNFGGGQVDITNGKFVFSCTLAYCIEDGKITYPIKGAMLMGDGPNVLKKVSQVGNDLSLDPGIGTCGKNGQNVPVGVGQPSLKVDSLLVGGTSS